MTMRFRSQKFWTMKRNKHFCAKIWIGKAIVPFQTPEFQKVKRYKYFHANQKIWVAKAIVSFQTPEFLRWSDTSTFTHKNLSQRSVCIASNPRIF